ncbi:DUF987 family protein [Salmonella enterica subsp. enterica]|nr:DUF987 family protein [Salmonella enterica subsp. enterica]
MTLYRQTPGSRLWPLTTGHYRWTGSVCHYAGRHVPDIRGVLAVLPNAVQDRHGPYALPALCDPELIIFTENPKWTQMKSTIHAGMGTTERCLPVIWRSVSSGR